MTMEPIGLYSPLKIRSVTLKNRIVLSPMATYSSDPEGRANDWHLVHYGARAIGGAGLILFESTAIDPLGRLSLNDLGLWKDDQIAPLARIIEFCHSQGAAVGVQINHGGRKASPELTAGTGRALVAPSPISFQADANPPHPLSGQEIKDIVQLWKMAALRACTAGFDVLEIHAAHGFLLHQFLSPLANHRDDEYGGNLYHRMRLLVEVLQAVRQVWPEDRPIFVRISATDWAEGGAHRGGLGEGNRRLEGFQRGSDRLLLWRSAGHPTDRP